MSHAFSSNLTSVILAAFTLTACQTAPVSFTRSPATTGQDIDPRVRELLQKDAAEAFGLVNSRVLLAARTNRFQVDPQFIQGKMPTMQEGWLSNYGAGDVGKGFFGFLSILSYARKPDASWGLHNFHQWLARLVTGRYQSLMGLTAVSGGVLLTSSYGSFRAITRPIFEGPEGRNTVDLFQLVFRRGELLDAAETSAGAANAKIQAKFIADLKQVAARISEQTAVLLKLSLKERTLFAARIESQMLDEFRVNGDWNAGEEIRIDLFRLLRTINAEVEDRLVIAEHLWNGLGTAKTFPLNSMEDALAWYREMKSSAERLSAEIEAEGEQIALSDDPRLKSTIGDYRRLASEVLEFADTLALHKRIVEKSIAERVGH